MTPYPAIWLFIWAKMITIIMAINQNVFTTRILLTNNTGNFQCTTNTRINTGGGRVEGGRGLGSCLVLGVFSVQRHKRGDFSKTVLVCCTEANHDIY